MMAWVRLEDTFPEHPKVGMAGGAAAWLFVCGLAYCNRNETDGVIATDLLPRLSDLRNPRKLADRLVDVGLWEPHPKGWLVHDFLDYQPSRASREQVRADARSRMRSARESKQGSRDVRANTDGMFAKSSRNPDPTRPDPLKQDDDDTDPVTRGSPSSSDRERTTLALAAARALAAKRTDLTRPAGWIQRTAKGLLDERSADIDRCITQGYTLAVSIELLTTSEQAKPAAPAREAWYANPNCDQCGGDGWVNSGVDNSCFQCHCRRTDPYPTTPRPTLRSVT